MVGLAYHSNSITIKVSSRDSGGNSDDGCSGSGSRSDSGSGIGSGIDKGGSGSGSGSDSDRGMKALL